jgi:ketosteroid isomerase-like protein
MRFPQQRLGFLVAILLLATGCASRRDVSARNGIDAAYKVMETGFQQGKPELIAAGYTADAEWYPPDGPVIKGPSAIGRAWRDNGAVAGNRLRIDVADVDQDGGRADEIGRFTISAHDGSVVAAGKYLVVWARQPDGSWKARRGMYNWDIPPRRP